jgi:hypothetical protein
MAAGRSSAMGGRQPANAALRGGALIVLAVVIGVALLAWGFAEEGGLVDSGSPESPATTEPPGGIGDETTEPGDDNGDGTDTTEPGEILPPARDREEITPLVLNASGVNGAAGRVRDRLLELNYTPRSPETAPDRSADTIIYYEDGWRAEALQLAGDLNIASPSAVVQSMPVPAPMGVVMEAATLLVILGEDELIAVAAG